MELYSMKPIGVIRSCFPEKFGTPRQGLLCPSTRGHVRLDTKLCPPGCLQGLDEFSHVWLIFVFHKNNTPQHRIEKPNSAPVKAKVKPPRLQGKSVGLFASRTPHRPNAIGLTIAILDKISIRDSIVFLKGIDLIDGTPILDIKPYHPCDALSVSQHGLSIPSWVSSDNVAFPRESITIQDEVQEAIRAHVVDGKGDHYRVDQERQKLPSGKEDNISVDEEVNELISAVTEVIGLDMRGTYQKELEERGDREAVYGFTMDNLNIRFRVCAAAEGASPTVDVFEVEHWPKGRRAS